MNCKDIGIELLSVDIFSAEVYQLRWKILTNTDQEIFFFFLWRKGPRELKMEFLNQIHLCIYKIMHTTLLMDNINSF